jgi:hypothetical protein
MNIADQYPKRRSLTPVYGYNSTLTVHEDTSEFSSTYDYVMVFKQKGTNLEHQSKHAKHCIHAMMAAGLEIFPYLSVQNDELVVLIRCPVSFFLLNLFF